LELPVNKALMAIVLLKSIGYDLCVVN
jgi:hypothetical protein